MPIISGKTVDRRDQVLITFWLLVSLATATFFQRLASM
jgi:hypothetical protein